MKHNEGFLAIVKDAKTRVKQETAQQALNRVSSASEARLVDVREDHEWRAGHLEDAVHLSKGIIERDIEKAFPNKDTELHLYCGGGYRSALVADNLQKMGYMNVISIDGGFKLLQELGAKIVKGQ